MSAAETFRCGPEGGGAVTRDRGGRRFATVDIHCHLLTQEADALTKPHRKVENEPLLNFASAMTREISRRSSATLQPMLTDIAVRLAHMDKAGIDIQVLSPAPTQYCYWAEAELARENARLVNDRIAEVVAGRPDRFAGLGTVPLQEPELAVAELTRAVKTLGLRGVEIGTNVAGAELADPRFQPFFAAAEALGILVFMHPIGFTEGRRLSDYHLNNVIGNPLESTIALSHLIFGGVLDRHPGLKICVAHGGGYMPAYPGRFEHAHGYRQDTRQHCQHPPSHYLKRLYYDTVVFAPEQLEALVARYGAAQVMLGTDYPYDMAEPDPVGFLERAALGDEDRALIAGGNAARLLGLTLGRAEAKPLS